MKKIITILTAGILLYSCAAYKQLEPKPELVPQELGYVELKNDDEFFELDKGKKYFIVFPAPVHEKSYLVLENNNKNLFSNFLAELFDDGKGDMPKAVNETPDPQRLDVFALDDNVQKFYWVIEDVAADMELRMTYRYVEKWRFKFETQYDSYRKTLADNRVDRSPYENIGAEPAFQQGEISSFLGSIESKSAELEKMQGSIQELEKYFPVTVANTTDTSYQNYLHLKTDLKDEIEFQMDFGTVLKLYKYDLSSRGAVSEFLNELDAYEDFYKARESFPQNVVSGVREILERRMPEAVPYYKQELSAKRNSNKIDFKTGQMNRIYSLAGISAPADFTRLHNFVRSYNNKVSALEQAETDYQALANEVNSNAGMPSNTYFGKILTRLSKLKYNLPAAGGKDLAAYKSSKCVSLLNTRIRNLRSKINKLHAKYREADALVPKMNAYKNQKNYRAMLGLLKKNPHLGFLKNMYQNVDKLSLKRQKDTIKNALAVQNWAAAEEALQTLYNDNNFIDYKGIRSQKAALVKTMEDSLFNKIERISLQNARQLADANLNTYTDVENIYANAAFMPVYTPSFSRISQANLEKRNSRTLAKINNIKENEFPARAVQNLYQQVKANPNDNGVLKARAAAAHGKYYKGGSLDIKRSIAECDPWASKWLTKAKDYRGLFALPVTNKSQGKNEYVFRINLKIPSDAKFPVYEVYIRLSEEVAKNAGATQWYDKITLNKKQVKNEGRFSITSPTAANGYLCQITPLRAEKGKDNVLEIHFSHPTLKIHQVSVMAQKPIIKKH